MKKSLNLFSIFILSSLFLISCSKELDSTEVQNESVVTSSDINSDNFINDESDAFNLDSSKDVTYDIDEISPIYEEENLNRILDSISSYSLKDFNLPEKVTYTNLEGNAIVLTKKEVSEPNNVKENLILLVDSNFELISYTERFESSVEDGMYTVKVKQEGSDLFEADVSSETGEIINYRNQADIGFWECLSVVADACIQDSECAFLCGIIFEYCLGAIVLACLYVSI